MKMPDPAEVAKRDHERKREEIEDAPPMTPSERYAMLSLYAENHRHGLNDMPGRATFDALTHSRPPVTRYNSWRPGLADK